MSRQVGMESKEQVALKAESIAFQTSSKVAGVKEDKEGEESGRTSGEELEAEEVKEELSLAILSPK